MLGRHPAALRPNKIWRVVAKLNPWCFNTPPISEVQFTLGIRSMETKPKYPWRLDTNERYREVVRTLMGLATASLLLPVFFAREFLGIEATIPLKRVFGTGVYWSWVLLVLAIFAGVLFHFLSAKWVRLAWGQSAGVFGIPASENFIENAMEVCFWTTAVAFIVGLVLVIEFFVTYEARP